MKILARVSFLLALLLSSLSLSQSAAQSQESVSVKLNSQFSASVSWMINPESSEDVLRGYVQFTPDSQSRQCSKIRFIQVARVETSPNQDYQWQSPQENRNQMRTQNGFFVDHDGAACSAGAPCSPYYRDSWSNADESEDGQNSPTVHAKASLVDYPFGWTLFQRIRLESCARCMDDGQFFGCVSWGGNWPSVGARELILPRFATRPSNDFIKALELFQQFYQ